nr:acetylxylan esterase 2 [Quercus suber]
MSVFVASVRASADRNIQTPGFEAESQHGRVFICGLQHGLMSLCARLTEAEAQFGQPKDMVEICPALPVDTRNDPELLRSDCHMDTAWPWEYSFDDLPRSCCTERFLLSDQLTRKHHSTTSTATMHFQSLTLLSALAVSAFATPVPDSASAANFDAAAEARDVEKRAQPCVPAVVFAVRGSDDQQTTLGFNPRYNQLPSGMTAAANAVFSKNGGDASTGLRPLNYPAISASQTNLANGNYGRSVDQGIGALQQVIVDYVNQCPTGKIFVMGYSQGGQVTSGALAGNPSHAPLKAKGRLTAGVIYADPTYIDGLSPIDQGSGANNGREGTAAGNGDKQRFLNANFAGRVQTYCQAGDQFCDSGTGPDAGSIHGNSPEFFQNQAIAFLTSK